MGSSSRVSTDASAITATDAATVTRFGSKNTLGSTLITAKDGSTLTVQNKTTDFGSVQGGLDLSGKVLDLVGNLAGQAGSLSKLSIDATRAAALDTTKQLSEAYAGAKGTINTNAIMIFVGVVALAAVAAFAFRGAK